MGGAEGVGGLDGGVDGGEEGWVEVEGSERAYCVTHSPLLLSLLQNWVRFKNVIKESQLDSVGSVGLTSP